MKSFIQSFIVMREIAFEDAFIWINLKKNDFDLFSSDVNENEKCERSRFESALVW